MSHNSKLQDFTSVKTEVRLPSNRKNEIADMSRTLRNNQRLKKMLSDETRRTTYANNHWRDSASKVVNNMKGDESRFDYKSNIFKERSLKETGNRKRLSGRAKSVYKYEKKQKEVFKKQLDKGINWARKKKFESITYNDTFKRVQKVKTDIKQPLTLRGSRFCFKK
mmetsp:Transcript_16422/g.14342  ORF Transcript_16422/g.14342 Transcript_16422/m.14342 type:complete len:166 (+) Transcript_16422:467-964(+)